MADYIYYYRDSLTCNLCAEPRKLQLEWLAAGIASEDDFAVTQFLPWRTKPDVQVLCSEIPSA